MAHLLEKNMLQEFRNQLKAEEKAQATIEKYMRDVSAFFAYAKEGSEIDKYTVIAYKEYLTGHYAAASVNSMLAAVNSFLKAMGWHECTVKALKIQKEAFRARERDLTKGSISGFWMRRRKRRTCGCTGSCRCSVRRASG